MRLESDASVNKHGALSALARNLRLAVIQGTLLYASEITWVGESSAGMEREYQRVISALGRATLGAFKSTPPAIIMAESELAPARAQPDSRQASFARQLMARPKDHHGPTNQRRSWSDESPPSVSG